MKYLFDAYAWVAYLEGGKDGEKINAIIKSNNEIYTLPTTITEVISKIKRLNGNTETAYMALIKNSRIADITPKLAKEAGILHAESRKDIPNISMADTLLIVSAKAMNAKVLTGDPHFKHFKEAILL